MAQETRKMVRTFRHWKQRFHKNSDFVWRRPTRYAGELYLAGDPIPDHLKDSPTKLRRFWESKRIELAEFEDPNVVTGQVETKTDDDNDDDYNTDLPEGVTVIRGNESGFIVGTPLDEFVVEDREALEVLLNELRSDDDDDDDPFK